MKIFTQLSYFAKDCLKNIAHRISFIPYRKPSKRYKIWNQRRENRFLAAISKIFSSNSAYFDSIEVSIIMPSFNRAYCISKAIDSVLNQSHPSWNLIVVDDGSTDGIDLATEKYSSDKRIQVVKKKWGGVSQARNFGLERATGKYIFYLDTDNVWFPNYLRTMIVFMEIGKLQACYSGSKIIGDNSETQGFFGEPFSWIECLELNHIDINCFAHSKDLAEKGFRFDENLKRLVDWDFILGLTAFHRTAYAPFLGVEYYDGQQGNRITFTEHTGIEIKSLIEQIQRKHQQAKNSNQVLSPDIRPDWKEIIRKAVK
jgi:glycosyltransferase involved in cell wall biosynthesis